MKFTKIMTIALVLIALSTVGVFAQDVSVDIGAFVENDTAGGEVGVNINRFNIALRAGGLGIVIDNPELTLGYDVSDSGGYSESGSEVLFPQDGQSLNASMSMFSLGLRGSYDIVSKEYFSVYAGAGVTWKRVSLSGEFSQEFEDHSITVNVDANANGLELPIFVGVEFEPFERAEGLVFGLEAGYKMSWLLNASGEGSMKAEDSTDWEKMSGNVDVDPNLFAHGFMLGASVKYRF